MSGPQPDTVRTAILAAADAIATARGYIPPNVGIPLMVADCKLREALFAVDAWEASLRAKEVPE